MPFIIARVNVPVSKEQETEIKNRMGRAIELVPGKSEQYLLLAFEPESHLWLRGDDSQPMAYIDAAIFGNEGHYGYRTAPNPRNNPANNRGVPGICSELYQECVFLKTILKTYFRRISTPLRYMRGDFRVM